jgi:hypothetical protein
LPPELAGRTEADAHRRYAGPLQRAICCFAENVFFLRSGYDPRANAEVLALNSDSVELRDHAGGEPRVALTPTLRYRLEPLPGPPRRWAARTVGYTYTVDSILTRPGLQAARYEWHPWVTGTTFPHVHPSSASGPAQRLHLITGYLTLKDVFTFLMRDGNVVPIRDDWEAALAEADAILRASMPPAGS